MDIALTRAQQAIGKQPEKLASWCWVQLLSRWFDLPFPICPVLAITQVAGESQ